jgi:hypothetical protein
MDMAVHKIQCPVKFFIYNSEWATIPIILGLVENSKRAIEMDSYANDDLKYFWRWAQKIAQFSDVADLQKSSLTK